MATTGAQGPIDARGWSELEQLTDGDFELMNTVLRQFLEDGALIVRELRRAVQERDATQVERLAHTLGSTSANVGAHGLAGLSDELRSWAIGAAANATIALLVPLECEFESVSAEIEKRLAELRAAD